MVSPLWKSGHLPQLINYSPPGKWGLGGMMRLQVRLGRVSGSRAALVPLMEPGPEHQDPSGDGGGPGRLSSRWRGSCRPPGTSPCDAGPPVAGPHCWAWAEREKEELEKRWPAGPGAAQGTEGLWEAGAAHERAALWDRAGAHPAFLTGGGSQGSGCEEQFREHTRAGANEPPLTGAGEAAGRLDKRTRGEQQGQVQAEALSREGSGKTLERSNVRAPGEDSRAQSWPEVLSESQTDRGPRPPIPQEVPRRGRALKTASFGHLGLQCAHITCTLTHTPLALTVIGKLTFFNSFSLKLNATPTH